MTNLTQECLGNNWKSLLSLPQKFTKKGVRWNDLGLGFYDFLVVNVRSGHVFHDVNYVGDGQRKYVK